MAWISAQRVEQISRVRRLFRAGRQPVQQAAGRYAQQNEEGCMRWGWPAWQRCHQGTWILRASG